MSHGCYVGMLTGPFRLLPIFKRYEEPSRQKINKLRATEDKNDHFFSLRIANSQEENRNGKLCCLFCAAVQHEVVVSGLMEAISPS